MLSAAENQDRDDRQVSCIVPGRKMRSRVREGFERKFLQKG